jgi:hypothetical protein
MDPWQLVQVAGNLRRIIVQVDRSRKLRMYDS